jgi:hypothetical protein
MTTTVMRMDCERRQASSVETEDKDEPKVGAEAELEAAPRAFAEARQSLICIRKKV